MGDDWRLRVQLDEEDHAKDLVDRLARFDTRDDLGTSFHARVIVSRDGLVSV